MQTKMSREEKIAFVRKARVTWQTAASGDLVWIPTKEGWLPGKIDKLGNTFVTVLIAHKASKVLYAALRQRKEEYKGDDKPLEEVPA